MIIRQWGAKHGIPLAALLELEAAFGLVQQAYFGEPAEGSESRQQSLIRLEASEKDIITWRNNVGSYEDKRGIWVRYGLANESKKQNKSVKSSDLIGIRRRLILPWMVPPTGLIVGQLVARECKHLGWSYSGTEHEVAQLNFLQLVAAYGGDASFATGPGTL